MELDEAAAPGVVEYALTFSDLGEMLFLYDEQTDEFTLDSHNLTDCGALLTHPVYQAAEELYSLVDTGLVVLPSDHPAWQVAAVLALAVDPPRLSEECSTLHPWSTACQPESSYEECKECCESKVVLSFFCGVGAGIFCYFNPKACKTALGACAPVYRFDQAVCMANNCQGKPGAPDCPDNPPPCEYQCNLSNWCHARQQPACGDCSHVGSLAVCCEN